MGLRWRILTLMRRVEALCSEAPTSGLTFSLLLPHLPHRLMCWALRWRSLTQTRRMEALWVWCPMMPRAAGAPAATGAAEVGCRVRARPATRAPSEWRKGGGGGLKRSGGGGGAGAGGQRQGCAQPSQQQTQAVAQEQGQQQGCQAPGAAISV